MIFTALLKNSNNYSRIIMTFKLKTVKLTNGDSVTQLFWGKKALTGVCYESSSGSGTTTTTNKCVLPQGFTLKLLTDVDKHWLMGDKTVADNELVTNTTSGKNGKTKVARGQANFCVVYIDNSNNLKNVKNAKCDGAYVFDHTGLLFSFVGSITSYEPIHLMRFLHHNDTTYLLAKVAYGTLALFNLSQPRHSTVVAAAAAAATAATTTNADGSEATTLTFTSAITALDNDHMTVDDINRLYEVNPYLVNLWRPNSYLTGLHLATVQAADVNNGCCDDSHCHHNNHTTEQTYLVVTGWIWHPMHICYHLPLEKLLTVSPTERCVNFDPRTEDNLFGFSHRHTLGDSDDTGLNDIGLPLDDISVLPDHTGLQLKMNGTCQSFAWPVLDKYQWSDICRFMASQAIIPCKHELIMNSLHSTTYIQLKINFLELLLQSQLTWLSHCVKLRSCSAPIS